MRIYTKYIEIHEKGDTVYDCDNELKGIITSETDGVYEVKFENGKFENGKFENGFYDEFEFKYLIWDSRNNWWEY
jgi:hypothetical protein